jgi:hypothetical protein
MRFIDLLSSAPITGTKNPNHVTAVRKTHGQHAAAGLSKAIEPWLPSAVREIPGDYTCWIQESKLRIRKRHAVLTLVLRVLGPIPSKLGLTAKSIADVWCSRHTAIWAQPADL